MAEVGVVAGEVVDVGVMGGVVVEVSLSPFLLDPTEFCFTSNYDACLGITGGGRGGFGRGSPMGRGGRSPSMGRGGGRGFVGRGRGRF